MLNKFAFLTSLLLQTTTLLIQKECTRTNGGINYGYLCMAKLIGLAWPNELLLISSATVKLAMYVFLVLSKYKVKYVSF